MATIVQHKERGGIRRHEAGNAFELLNALSNWYSFYRSVDGLRPRWIGVHGFTVFRDRDGKPADTFKLEGY